MENNTFKLEDSFGHWIQRLAGQAHWAFEKRLAPHGVSAPQFAVLLSIYRGAKQPSEVAAELDVDAAAITRLLDRLGEKGLLKRCSGPHSDRRSIGLELTDEGTALMPQLAPLAANMNDVMLDGLNAKERAQLLATVKKLYQQAKALNEEAP